MEKTFADLSKYVRRSPPFWLLLTVLLILFALELLNSRSLLMSFFMIPVTAAITITIDQIFSRYFKSHLNLKKNLFLFVLTFLMFFIIYILLDLIFPFFSTQNIAISLSFASFFRFLVFYVYLSDNDRINYLNSLSLTLSFIPLFLFYVDYTVMAEAILYSLISAYLSYFFVTRATSTFRNEFHEEPRQLIKFFLYSTTSKKYYDVGDRFFKRIYSENRTVPVNFIRILNEKEENVVTMVFPYIHPGPFGLIGTSDLPRRLQDRLTDLNSDFMVFHTSTTNNNNCSGDEDIDSIADAIRNSWNGISQSKTMSRIVSAKSSGIILDGMKFGNFGFLALNPDKVNFDDILLTEGEKLWKYIEKEFNLHFSILDAQNNFSKGAKEITDTNPYFRSSSRLISRMNDRYKGKAGYSRRSMNLNSIGKMGIQAIVFDYGDQKNAIILTDSNNITGSLMKEIRQVAKNMVDYVAIYTTDNHIVNQGSLDMNPLGEKDDIETIRNEAIGAIKDAIDHIQDVSFIYGHVEVNVKMGSEDSYRTLMNTVFASLSKAKYYAAFSVSLTLLIPFILSITGFVYKIPFIR